MEAGLGSSDLVESDESGGDPSRAEPVARAEAVDFCWWEREFGETELNISLNVSSERGDFSERKKYESKIWPN